jgi:mannose-6-phosphate isomerase-like protein (cupin superfamily)
LWPDGKKETLTHLAADKFYVVREGQGVVARKLPEDSANLP